MTLNDLIAKYNTLAIAAGLPTRKGFDNKAKAEAAIASLTGKGKGAKLKVAKAAKTAKVVKIREKGPRGFKFGPVWLQSIRDGAGVALKPANLPKLRETAQAYSVTLTKDLNQAEMAAAIAKVI